MSKFYWIPLVWAALFAWPAPAHGDSGRVGAGLSLGDAIRLAQQRAPEVMNRRALATASRSSLVGARLVPLGNPYLEIVAERPIAARTGQTSVTGTLYLPLELGGQRSRRIGEARAFIAYHDAGLVEARAFAAGDTVRAYGTVVVETERVRLLTEVADAARTEAEAYLARVRAGDATLRDAKLAEVESGRNDVLLARARTELERAERELGLLIGRPHDQVPSLVTSEPPGPPRALGTRSVDRAPALASSRAEAELHARARERWSREATGPLSLILVGGRDELGQARLGGGVAYAFPTFRANQGEQARAEADRGRALAELDVKRQVLESRVAALSAEFSGTVESRRLLERSAIPASRGAVDAAVEMHRAGKGELLTVIVSRRDHALLRLERLDLVERQWAIVADLVGLTGVAP
jgi:outer membrane protein, heavy metal efflux system